MKYVLAASLDIIFDKPIFNLTTLGILLQLSISKQGGDRVIFLLKRGAVWVETTLDFQKMCYIDKALPEVISS